MKSQKVFEISEESDSGGSNYCWVTYESDSFYLYGIELGRMSGPCGSITEAFDKSGFQFGMDYLHLTCEVTAEELHTILLSSAFVLENVSSVTINDLEAPNPDADSIVEVYRRSKLSA